MATLDKSEMSAVGGNTIWMVGKVATPPTKKNNKKTKTWGIYFLSLCKCDTAIHTQTLTQWHLPVD